ncbi:MAG TPA: kelch repeat-containing protein [Pirellulales bacterium]|jgi:hypothetical protein|nr:kelch repeat-containing protein [Pirellulales bacterium]
MRWSDFIYAAVRTLGTSVLFCALVAGPPQLKAADAPANASLGKPFRLPMVEVKEPLLWAVSSAGEPGQELRFGGENQLSADGLGHTVWIVGGQSTELFADLERRNPNRALYDDLKKLQSPLRKLQAEVRKAYFEGAAATAANATQQLIFQDADALVEKLTQQKSELSKAASPFSQQTAELDAIIKTVKAFGSPVPQAAVRQPVPADEAYRQLRLAADRLAELTNRLGPEPPPRALGALTYDAQAKRFVLFGGDHGDYLTNDVWTFDPAQKSWQWRPAAEAGAPPPRANATWQTAGAGQLKLSGGYAYASNTDYVGGQYREWHDGDWLYDLASNRWSGTGQLVPERHDFRTGLFLPEAFMTGPAPGPAAVATRLRDLPANTWVSLHPPQLPVMNRDWGSAILDQDHDLILRWAGGHSAHGGTDVLQYHLHTNRWELTEAVEFPLGQTYSNTSYPDGFNFNHRPWVTGHTYQSYGYEPTLKQMLFVGHKGHTYFYDPALGDWLGRIEKPKPMQYGDCFYTLTCCTTPHGLYCWTNEGELFLFQPAQQNWAAVTLSGDKLAGASVDNSTMAYDSRRDRLVCFRKPYGDDHAYDGTLYFVDLKSGKVQKRAAGDADFAAKIPYLCQIRYDAKHDLLLVGGTISADHAAQRLTPIYSCAQDQWSTMEIRGDDPSGPKGRNVSLGLMVDDRSDLFWAVDAKSNVFVLRLEPPASK